MDVYLVRRVRGFHVAFALVRVSFRHAMEDRKARKEDQTDGGGGRKDFSSTLTLRADGASLIDL